MDNEQCAIPQRTLAPPALLQDECVAGGLGPIAHCSFRIVHFEIQRPMNNEQWTMSNVQSPSARLPRRRSCRMNALPVDSARLHIAHFALSISRSNGQ